MLYLTDEEKELRGLKTYINADYTKKKILHPLMKKTIYSLSIC